MTDDSILAAQAAIQQIRAAVAAHLRRERVVALYLAGGSPRRTVAVLGAAAAELRAAGQGALLSRRRTAPIARARQMAMCLLREQGLTYSGRLHDHVAITAFVWCSYQVARCCCLTHGRAA